MADVFFKRVTSKELLDNPEIILKCIEKISLLKELPRNELIALKIHFGEKGNTSYIKSDFLVPLVRFLKKNNKPFLFETNTLYRGMRMNSIDHINLAYAHGFSKLNIPIIIGDGIFGNDYFEVQIAKKHFQSCFLASALKDIKFMLVLSHFTGHMLTGFGAAIKNLGMGCASRKGKFSQHCEVSPKIDKDKCIFCGNCFKICPQNAIEKVEEKYFIIEEKCMGCAQCISACSQGAVKIIWSYQYNLISEKMAEYAYAVTKTVKCFYINFCIYITKECDCMNKEKTPILPDIGILFSLDPVSIDKASLDLVNNNSNKDLIKELHPQIDYLHQLYYAQEIGLGFLDYKLIEI